MPLFALAKPSMVRVVIPPAMADLADFRQRRTPDDEFGQFFGDRQQLIHPQAAFIAAVRAFLAADGAEEGAVMNFFFAHAQAQQGIDGRLNGFFALIAIRRARRCAMTPMMEAEMRNGSTPMSDKRTMVEGESLVCRVESTR